MNSQKSLSNNKYSFYSNDTTKEDFRKNYTVVEEEEEEEEMFAAAAAAAAVTEKTVGGGSEALKDIGIVDLNTGNPCTNEQQRKNALTERNRRLAALLKEKQEKQSSYNTGYSPMSPSPEQQQQQDLQQGNAAIEVRIENENKSKIEDIDVVVITNKRGAMNIAHKNTINNPLKKFWSIIKTVIFLIDVEYLYYFQSVIHQCSMNSEDDEITNWCDIISDVFDQVEEEINISCCTKRELIQHINSLLDKSPHKTCHWMVFNKTQNYLKEQVKIFQKELKTIQLLNKVGVLSTGIAGILSETYGTTTNLPTSTLALSSSSYHQHVPSSSFISSSSDLKSSKNAAKKMKQCNSAEEKNDED